MTDVRGLPDIRLEFDGLKLRAVNSNNGNIVASWDAISGRPGNQSANTSNVVNTGPIPEGNWSISTSNILDMADLPIWRQYMSETGILSPSGGVSSWGSAFTRIEPAEGTETFGRDGFYLHGGNEAGSAGCIGDFLEYIPMNSDLTKKLPMNEYAMTVMLWG
jgi:hypothetical protein